MRIFLTHLFICAFVFSAAAQSGKLKLGKQKMDNLDYVGAIELYNQVLENHDDAEAKINLAEAYRKINDTPNAEFWYGQVVRLAQAEPIHRLYYGMMLQRNGKCDLAREWYQQYVDLVPDDQRGQYLLRACDYEDELTTKNASVFEVTNCSFNSKSDDFSPYFYKKGLVFSSERDTNPIIRRTHTWTGNPFLELYYLDLRQEATRDDACGNYTFGRPEKFSSEINSKFHDASVAFSKNGEEIFFTRNNYINGKKGQDDAGIMRLKIFYARSEGEGKWGALQSLPFNSDEYSVAHPALSADGNKLYFASDMPGGFGGMDLYVSEKENGRWGPPLNLGPEINTEGHEIFPFVGPGSQLYFASDGHVGLGGLDIFYTTDKGNGIWSTPENMGFPVNTNADDFSIIFNNEGTCGFFASNRQGGVGGDDIYSFKKKAIQVEILVYDDKTDIPLEGASVQVACKGTTMTTDLDGKIRFDMKLNDCCQLNAALDGYVPNQIEACSRKLTLKDKLVVKLPLTQSARFEIEGIVFDKFIGLMMEGATVSIENDCGEPLADPVVTSPTGKYYFKLDKECCYKVKATKDGYFAGIVEEVCTKGLDDSKTFKENLYLNPISVDPNQFTPEDWVEKGQETTHTYYDPVTDTWMDKDTRMPADGKYADGKMYNKGVLTGEPDFGPGPTTPTSGDPNIRYLLHVYYDFDQSYIRADAKSELEKLYTLLTENPQYIIEIGSHTDSRGSDHYNQRLSQRRAEAVVRWLTDKGVDRSRLVARGYGETANVNNCVNYVPCTEREHQMNRRTEFKVIGCTNCLDPSKTLLSKENPNVKVDPCKNCPF